MQLDLDKLKLFNEIYTLAAKTITERTDLIAPCTDEEYKTVDQLFEKALIQTFGNEANFLEASYKGATLLSYAAGKKEGPEPLSREIHNSMSQDRSTLGWALTVRFDSAAAMTSLAKELNKEERKVFFARLKAHLGEEHPANKPDLRFIAA